AAIRSVCEHERRSLRAARVRPTILAQATCATGGGAEQFDDVERPVGAAMIFGIYGMIFLLPLLWQGSGLLSVEGTGLALLPCGLVFFLVAQRSDHLANRIGVRVVIANGTAMIACGLLVLAANARRRAAYGGGGRAALSGFRVHAAARRPTRRRIRRHHARSLAPPDRPRGGAARPGSTCVFRHVGVASLAPPAAGGAGRPVTTSSLHASAKRMARAGGQLDQTVHDTISGLNRKRIDLPLEKLRNSAYSAAECR
ncbi:MAG: hypothetical protein ACREFY_01720, partial [Acetobacteraceae bacterium]